ncbi:MFS transporter [Staphylococcus gallinarum]|uniref:MFS transporter n=1 Tax=Staphylococcus gallinarum TaxID=1293 RepID=UPI003F545C9E
MKKSNYNNISIYIILNALFLFAFTQFLLINVYPTLMNEFNINSSQIQLLTTLFLFTTLLLIPFSSFISNRFQSNTLINVSLAFLIIGTIIGSQSYDFYLLLFSRIIQGIGFAIILPISQTVILNISNNNNQAMYLGILNSVINIGPAIAPPVTGIFIEYLEWRSLYYIMLPLEFILFILSLLFLKNNFTKKGTTLILNLLFYI